MDTSDHEMSDPLKGPESGCEGFDRHQKCGPEVSLHFEL